MEQILFPNFLEDHVVYESVKKYWVEEVQKLLDVYDYQQHFMWNLDTEGNPIFSCKVIRGKAIRIIQHEVEQLPATVAAWIKATEDRQEWKIDELVLVVHLTSQTAKLALNLIEEWIKPTTTTSSMNLYISNSTE